MRRVFLFSFLAGSFFVPSAYAELRIDPNPPINGNIAPQAAPAAISFHDSFPVKVPQPGDAYFDPPSAAAKAMEDKSDAYSQEQATQKGIEAFRATETFQTFNGQEQSENFAAVAPSAEPIEMQMSADPFEGMQRETAEIKASALPQSKPQDIEPASGYAPEEIIWSGPRVEVKPMEPKPMQEGPVWAALAGANISQVLGNWSRDAGVELIWETPNAFAVLESFEMGGTFESAVQNLLDQYKNNQVRPVATLHIDPESGQKTLIVKGLDES